MARVIIAALLFLVRPAFAADPWTEAQVGQQVAFTVLLAADWGQTREIADSCEHYGVTWDTSAGGWSDVDICAFRETNPILGERPTTDEVDRFFLASAALNLAVAHVLPSKWRSRFQYLSIGIEAGFVAHNYSIGVRVDL